MPRIEDCRKCKKQNEVKKKGRSTFKWTCSKCGTENTFLPKRLRKQVEVKKEE